MTFLKLELLMALKKISSLYSFCTLIFLESKYDYCISLFLIPCGYYFILLIILLM